MVLLSVHMIREMQGVAYAYTDRERLRMTSSSEEMGEGISMWQPIQTAPKDGREILMFYTPADGGLRPPLVVAWDTMGECWLAVGFEVEVLSEPTHWMPLPAAPGTATRPATQTAAIGAEAEDLIEAAKAVIAESKSMSMTMRRRAIFKALEAALDL